MWHSIFHVDVPLAEKIIRPILIYVFLVVALRLAGKRELAQLNSLDFIVLLAVANAVQNGIIGNDNSVTGGVVGAATLFVLNGVLAFVLFRNARLRRLVEGSPTVLIKDGVVNESGLRHEELTMDELLQAIESQGARDPGEVERATLEPNGSIVTVLKSPDYETEHFLELRRQLEELKAMVSSLSAGPEG